MTQPVSDTVKKQLTEFSKNSSHHMDMQRLMTRYAIERFMWRVGQSKHGEAFILKGAFAFGYHLPKSTRTTKDVDFMMFGQMTAEKVKAVVTAIATAKAPDGVSFSAKGITVRAMGAEGADRGYSVRIPARIGFSVCPVDVDISFGDAVYPEARKVSIPSLIVGKALNPVLKVYPIETIIAEKYQTIVRLGMSNTRLKDHQDLYEIAQYASVTSECLMKAIQGVFARRGTPIAITPDGLSEAFYGDKIKQREWKTTLTAHNMTKGIGLDEACEAITRFVGPVAAAMENDEAFDMVWRNSKWKKLDV